MGPGEGETYEEETATGRTGSAATAIAVAGALLRPRKCVNVHEHSGN